MSKKVLVISTSPRAESNSEILADEFIKGAIDGGNVAEKITLHNKQINFCRGCLACWQLKKCIIDDDASKIAQMAFEVDVIVFASPIYFYEMSGQMKTLLDRVGALYTSDYKFREIYFLATSASPEKTSMDGAIKGLKGWVKCFDKSKLCGVVSGLGVAAAGEIKGDAVVLKKAYNLGRAI